MTTTRKKTGKKTGTAIAETKDQLPAVYEYGDDAGQGIADATREELSIPFLTVLQALSPQVSGEAAIEDAKAGMLFNTVTGDLTDGKEGIQFVPALRQHVFVEWVPRDQGGGFVAMYQPTDDVVVQAKSRSEQFGKYKTEAGNDLVETFYLYGILLDADGDPAEMAVLAFTSTKVKKYKAVVSKMRYLMVPGPDGGKINPPLYANRLVIKSIADKNAKGAFFNFDVSFAINGNGRESLLATDHPAYGAAKELAAAVNAGDAKADHASTVNEAGADGTGDTDEF